MKPLILLMLCVQVAIFLVTAYAVAIRKPTAARPTPVWSSFALSMLVIAMVSWTIVDRHEASTGVEYLQFGAAALTGMGVMLALMAFRARRIGAI